MIIERGIRPEWVQEAVQMPDLQTSEDHDSEIERFFKSVPEFDSRVFRVADNTNNDPWLIVTAFLIER